MTNWSYEGLPMSTVGKDRSIGKKEKDQGTVAAEK